MPTEVILVVLGPVAATLLAGIGCFAALALGVGGAAGALGLLVAGLLGLEIAVLTGAGAVFGALPREGRGRAAVPAACRRSPLRARRIPRLAPGPTR